MVYDLHSYEDYIANKYYIYELRFTSRTEKYRYKSSKAVFNIIYFYFVRNNFITHYFVNDVYGVVIVD